MRARSVAVVARHPKTRTGYGAITLELQPACALASAHTPATMRVCSPSALGAREADGSAPALPTVVGGRMHVLRGERGAGGGVGQGRPLSARIDNRIAGGLISELGAERYIARVARGRRA
jgi:hypothetical protein